MELIIAGILAFIISGLDDFTILVMLFMVASNNITKNLYVILGTLLMLILVIIISYYIGDIIKNYMWLLAILLIVYSIKNIVENLNPSIENLNKIDNDSNLFKLSMSIFLINAGDDFSIYSTSFANLSESIDYFDFSTGILIGGIIIIIIAYKAAHIISNIENLEKKFKSKLLLNIPYIIMFLIGVIIIYNYIITKS